MLVKVLKRFITEIDSTLSLKERVELGKYAYADKRIGNFDFLVPLEPEVKKTEVEMAIVEVHCPSVKWVNEIEEEIKKQVQLRSADTAELLAFGAQYPKKVKMMKDIFAARATNKNGTLGIYLHLTRLSRERTLEILWSLYWSRGMHYFLTVKE